MIAKILGVVTVALSLGKALAEVQLKGVNIAGFEFGCVTNVSLLLKHLFLTTNMSRAPVSRAAVHPPYCHRGNGSYLVSPSSTITPTESAKWNIFPRRMG